MSGTPILSEWSTRLQSAYLQQRGVSVGRLLDPSFLLGGDVEQGFTFLGCSESAKLIMNIDGSSQGISSVVPRGPRPELDQMMIGSLGIVKETLVKIPLPINWAKVVDMGIVSLNKVFDLFAVEEKANPLKSHSWLIPLLVKTVKFLTKSAFQADEVSFDAKNGELADTTTDQDTTSGRHQQAVLNAMRMHIGRCQRNFERLSSRSVFVVLMAESIRACIALRNLKIAGQFSKTIEQAGFERLDLSRTPNGPAVTYRATIGLLSMQQENFTKANDELGWAIRHMHRKKVSEKRDLIDKLVIVRLRLAVLPPKHLLDKYDISTIYSPMCQAIKTGNIKLFERTLNDNAAWFVEQGTLLIVERAKFLCYRTLVQRAVQYFREDLMKDNPDAPLDTVDHYYHVPMGLLTSIFKSQMESEDPDLWTEFDDEELGCIVTAVISKGLLKGYIAWKSKILVLSKQDPFPSVRTTAIKL
eukprot:GHVH01006249.1.p1 GENE.GHVH01006249.1~~GHVH01006249.1.p1  ORF type:complete len:471 (+),score=69.39 GHVH01006249.1:12-1424(+)